MTALPSLELPGIFSDHAVLQRDRAVPVWGRATPGARVTVLWSSREHHATADAAGAWRVDLPPEPVSFEPRRLVVRSGDHELAFNDILIGDVWLCSGQSNMEWSVGSCLDADIEILAARHHALRLYHVDNVTAQTPRLSSPRRWDVCSPQTIGRFSAVAYYFGRDLRHALDVPVGLIAAAWGGTPAIAWTRELVFPRHPDLTAKAAEWRDIAINYPAARARWETDLASWFATHDVTVFHEDPGIAPACARHHEPDFDDSDWGTFAVPQPWERVLGDFDGAVWFRRRVHLPAAFRGRALKLSLGVLDDFDDTFVNGRHLGGMHSVADEPWIKPRVYTVPAEITRDSDLVIAVRIFDRCGEGGFVSPANELYLENGADRLPLAGPWKFFVESRLKPSVGTWGLAPLGAPVEPLPPTSPHRPASLANGMLAPVAPYALRGAIWYQGETDAGWNPDHYEQRLRLMIEDWRAWWGIPDLPFGIVQLAGYNAPNHTPASEAWPRLRDSQFRLARNLSNAGLAVTIDVGEADDIHPRNKQTVGRRLARWALAEVYGAVKLAGGPRLASARFEGPVARLSFRPEDGALRAHEGAPLRGFTLAGPDRVFKPAEARIAGPHEVMVWSSDVAAAAAVRYAWASNPHPCNLANADRQPAAPFRTDDWPLPASN